MYYFDTLYSNPITGPGSYNEYPPGMQILEYIGMSLAGKWTDDVLYSSYWTIPFSICCYFIPDIKRNKKKNIWIIEIVVVLLCSICLSLSVGEQFYTDLYNNLSIDFPLGVCFAFGITLLLMDHKEKIKETSIQICLISAIIVLLKQSGKFFAVILLISYIIWINSTTLKNQRKAWLFNIIPVLFLVLVAISWEIKYRQYHTQAAFSASRFDLRELFAIISWKTNSEIRDIFINAIIKSKVPFGIVDMSNLVFVFAVSILYVLLNILSKTINTKMFIATGVVTLLGWFIYAIGLLICYLFVFDENEGIALASMQRYLNSYNSGIWISSVFYSCYLLESGIKNGCFQISEIHTEKHKRIAQIKLNVLLLGLILLLPLYSSAHKQIFRLTNGFYQQTANSKMKSLAEIAYFFSDEKEGNAYSYGQKGNILLVHNGGSYPHEAINGFAYLVYPNYYVPWECMYGDHKTFDDDRYTKIFTAKQFQEHIQELKIKYIAIDKLDTTFIQLYSSLFEGELKEGQIYEVGENGRYMLVYEVL